MNATTLHMENLNNYSQEIDATHRYITVTEKNKSTQRKSRLRGFPGLVRPRLILRMVMVTSELVSDWN